TLMVLRSCPALSGCVILSFGCLPDADGAAVLSCSQEVRDLVFWPAYLTLMSRPVNKELRDLIAHGASATAYSHRVCDVVCE
ncbi:hypothetical protein EV702DRAFT_1139019, partial [Suillus placidus]